MKAWRSYNMELLKRRVNKPGLEKYFDYYLVWYYNNRFFYVLVKPTFANENKLLLATASEVPIDTSLEDYYRSLLKVGKS